MDLIPTRKSWLSLKMVPADKILVIRVTFSNMWSLISGRTGRHERGPHFLLGEGQKGRHPTKGEGLLEILGISG